jgi:selenocysteine lyase/cysteine desulfurase
MNEQIRGLFPITEEYIYLNSAACAPMPRSSAEAVTAAVEDVMSHGSVHFMNWVNKKRYARELTAELLGVRGDQIAFMRNTSDGLSAIANGLKWQAGDNIVTFDKEFPSNFLPWRRYRDNFGVEIRACPEVNGRYDMDEFLALIDEKTRVVAVSAVQFSSGYAADLRRIGEAAHKVGGLLVVDIIQAFGAKTLDLEFVDAAAGSSHKWLFSPEGCGVLYLSDRALEMVEPTVLGWLSVNGEDAFDVSESPLWGNALAWESGTGAAALFYGLANSLEIIRDAGVANIEQYLNRLTDHLCSRAGEKGYEIVSSRAGSERSQIVCINHRSRQAQDIAMELEAKKIIVSARGGRIRIAPHLFNNIEDIDRLVEALP